MSAIELFAAVGAVPSLPGARCRGKALLFDGEDGPNGPKTQQAAALCRSCPALVRCDSWLAEQSDVESLHGVIAGRLFVWKPHACKRRFPQGIAVVPVYRPGIHKPPSANAVGGSR